MKILQKANPFGARLLFWLYSALVIKGAVMPADEIPSFLTAFNDKLIHGVEYFLLFWVTWNAFRLSYGEWLRVRAMGGALAYAVIMGILTEVLQIHSATRSPGLDDFGADILGAGLAFGLLFLKNRGKVLEK